MSRHVGVYRTLVRLYPARFKREYRNDLVQTFDDMVSDSGALRAWRRTTLDLFVTVPRYRLEALMRPRLSTASLFILVAVVAMTGVVTTDIGVIAGAILLVLGISIAITQRSHLAQSTRTPNPPRRSQLLKRSAILAITCVTTTTVFWFDLMGDEHWHGGKVMLYNAVFFFTAIGSLGCLIAGLCTPRGRALTR